MESSGALHRGRNSLVSCGEERVEWGGEDKAEETGERKKQTRQGWHQVMEDVEWKKKTHRQWWHKGGVTPPPSSSHERDWAALTSLHPRTLRLSSIQQSCTHHLCAALILPMLLSPKKGSANICLLKVWGYYRHSLNIWKFRACHHTNLLNWSQKYQDNIHHMLV